MVITPKEATARILTVKKAKGLTFEEISRVVCRHKVRVLAVWFLLMLAGLLLTIAYPTFTEAEVALTQVLPKLSVSGSLRTRWELWNWFEPTDAQNNDYDYLATVAKVALKWTDHVFDVMLEAQNSALIGLPRRAEFC